MRKTYFNLMRKLSIQTILPRPLSLPRRIFVGFLLVIIPFSLLSLASLFYHQRTAKDLDRLRKGFLPIALTLGEARASQAIFSTLLQQVLAEDAPPNTRSWLNTARRIRPATLRRALNGLEEIENLSPEEDEREVIRLLRIWLTKIEMNYEDTEPSYDLLFQYLEQNDEDRARAISEELILEEQKVSVFFRNSWNQLQKQISQTSANTAVQEKQAVMLLTILISASILIALLVLIWSQRLLKPISKLRKRVNEVARGKLKSNRIKPSSKDELGLLTEAFEGMVDALLLRDEKLNQAAQTEYRLQQTQKQIVENLSAGVMVIDQKGCLVAANPAARIIFQLSDSNLQKPLAQIQTLQSLSPLSNAIDKIQNHPSSLIIDSLQLDSNKEKIIRLVLTRFQIAADKEDSEAILIVAEDITEELKTKAELIQNERLAAIGKMAAHVTHEVRNPLSSIGLNLELLEDEIKSSSDETQSLFSSIHKEIDRLTEITKEYLQLTRLPSPQLEPSDLVDFFNHLLEWIRPEMSTHGIEVQFVAHVNKAQVAMDRDQLKQAFLNLLFNARDALSENIDGDKEISISIQSRENDWLIELTDNGKGMHEEELRHIFDLFFTTKERGTGLGLPLTEQIVLAHRGTIEGNSKVGEGTVFKIQLPKR